MCVTIATVNAFWLLLTLLVWALTLGAFLGDLEVPGWVILSLLVISLAMTFSITIATDLGFYRAGAAPLVPATCDGFG